MTARPPDAAALDTSIDTIARTRQKLVEEGLDAALTRKHSSNSARQRIFDGAAEAKLIALACSPPPKGRKRWTLTMLETAVVQLNIVDRASDNTIGRTLRATAIGPTGRLAYHRRITGWGGKWCSARGAVDDQLHPGIHRPDNRDNA